MDAVTEFLSTASDALAAEFAAYVETYRQEMGKEPNLADLLAEFCEPAGVE